MRRVLFLFTALASASSECDLYASTTAPFSNDHCHSFCVNGDLTSLDAYCVLVDVSMDGDVTNPKPGTCYNQWVYGYSDEGPPHLSSMDGVIHKQASAVQCQRFCQETAGCESFLFRAVAQAGPIPHSVGDCILKDATIIHGAIDMELGGSTGPSFCSTQQYHQCEHGGFTCKVCDGTTRCMWKSANHIGGPQYCGWQWDVCQWDPPTFLPPPTPKTTDATTTQTTTNPRTTTPLTTPSTTAPLTTATFTTSVLSTTTPVLTTTTPVLTTTTPVLTTIPVLTTTTPVPTTTTPVLTTTTPVITTTTPVLTTTTTAPVLTTTTPVLTTSLTQDPPITTVPATSSTAIVVPDNSSTVIGIGVTLGALGVGGVVAGAYMMFGNTTAATTAFPSDVEVEDMFYNKEQFADLDEELFM